MSFPRRGQSEPTTTELLDAELAAVTGDRCAWPFPDTDLTCQRAPDHAGAVRLVDVHVTRDPDGQLVTASEPAP